MIGHGSDKRELNISQICQVQKVNCSTTDCYEARIPIPADYGLVLLKILRPKYLPSILTISPLSARVVISSLWVGVRTEMSHCIVLYCKQKITVMLLRHAFTSTYIYQPYLNYSIFIWSLSTLVHTYLSAEARGRPMPISSPHAWQHDEHHKEDLNDHGK